MTPQDSQLHNLLHIHQSGARSYGAALALLDVQKLINTKRMTATKEQFAILAELNNEIGVMVACQIERIELAHERADEA